MSNDYTPPPPNQSQQPPGENDMGINLGVPHGVQQLQPKITVIGVGGAGGNAVNNMISQDQSGIDFVVANTDAQALMQARTDRKIQLGAKTTEGLGAGARPEMGRIAADEALEQIAKELKGAHMAFITAGMGGGTGTGAAPVVASAAREMGILTVGVVTKPFQFEGVHRMRIAEAGIEELSEYVDTLIVIPNQNLFRVANEKTTFADAFKMADDVLAQGVRGVTDLILNPGIINLDFADIQTVMSEMGKAMMGTGEAAGENRAVEAAEQAINNPLLENTSVKGARAVLINITGGMDLGFFEVDEAANRIRDEIESDANIIFGSVLDPNMDGALRVSVVATGIDRQAALQDQQTTADLVALRNKFGTDSLATPDVDDLAPTAIRPSAAQVAGQVAPVMEEPAPMPQVAPEPAPAPTPMPTMTPNLTMEAPSRPKFEAQGNSPASAEAHLKPAPAFPAKPKQSKLDLVTPAEETAEEAPVQQSAAPAAPPMKAPSQPAAPAAATAPRAPAAAVARPVDSFIPEPPVAPMEAAPAARVTSAPAAMSYPTTERRAEPRDGFTFQPKRTEDPRKAAVAEAPSAASGVMSAPQAPSTVGQAPMGQASALAAAAQPQPAQAAPMPAPAPSPAPTPVPTLAADRNEEPQPEAKRPSLFERVGLMRGSKGKKDEADLDQSALTEAEAEPKDDRSLKEIIEEREQVRFQSGDHAVTEPDENVEIPAFLRRQAN